jgi:hypothetical protein
MPFVDALPRPKEMTAPLLEVEEGIGNGGALIHCDKYPLGPVLDLSRKLFKAEEDIV